MLESRCYVIFGVKWLEKPQGRILLIWQSFRAEEHSLWRILEALRTGKGEVFGRIQIGHQPRALDYGH